MDENRLTPPSSPVPVRQPRSSPASPSPSKKGKRHQSASPIRHILNSPLLNRRYRKKQPESSDDENIPLFADEKYNSNNGAINGGHKQYRDLETFQKAQLRQKVSKTQFKNALPIWFKH